jgi:hypothetical protein
VTLLSGLTSHSIDDRISARTSHVRLADAKRRQRR